MAYVSYDIETQAAAAITNIGGDQTVYAGERRSGFSRWGALLGVALSLSGLSVLVLAGFQTTDTLLANDFWPREASYYTENVSGAWLPALVLLVTGLVVKRFARAAR
jgi:hypothetical protein